MRHLKADVPVEEPVKEEKKAVKHNKKKARRIRRLIGLALLMPVAVLIVMACLRLKTHLNAILLGAAALALVVPSLLLIFGPKRVSKYVYIACGVVFAAILVLAGLNGHEILMDGKTMRDDVTEFAVRDHYPDNFGLLTSVETLDMLNSDVRSFKPLAQMKSLKSLDVRGNYSFTQKEHDALAKARPDIDIRWSVPVGSAFFDSADAVFDVTSQELTTQEIREILAAHPDKTVRYKVPLFGQRLNDDATSVVLTDAKSFDAAELADAGTLLGKLKDVDLTVMPLGVDAIESLKAAQPGLSFRFTLDTPVGPIGEDTEEIALSEGTVDDINACARFFPLMPALKTVDFSAVPLDAQTVGKLLRDYPAIDFSLSYDTPLGTLTEETTGLFVTSGNYADAIACAAFLPYLPKLESFDIKSISMSFEQAQAFFEACGSRQLRYSFTIFGCEVSTADEFISLDGRSVESAEALELYLPYLPNVKQIDMCNCGLSDEEMAGLRERHPEIKFVWMLHFGHYEIRTDVEVFTTYLSPKNTYNYDSETFRPLQYCTDMKFLDLGHNHITDISMIAHMTDMRYLILACNWIEDISPIAGMKKLQYVELFNNKISNFSALTDMDELIDLNICINDLRDVTPITTCDKLRRLWIGRCGVSSSEVAQIKKALPKCKINTTSGNEPTREGWRGGKKYKTIKAMYWDRQFRELF